MLKFFANKKGLFGYFCDLTKVALGFGGEAPQQLSVGRGSGAACPAMRESA